MAERIGRKKKKIDVEVFLGKLIILFGVINIRWLLSRAALIKMFSPYGKIVAEDFLWHTRGPKRGEPRGFAFIQFSTKEVSCLLPISLFLCSS